MSVSGLKAELKFLESIFDKDHERFRIVSWKLDELHCQFVLLPPPPGSGPPPPPPLTIHCNITVRAGGSAPSWGHGVTRARGGFRPPPPRGRSGCALPGPAPRFLLPSPPRRKQKFGSGRSGGGCCERPWAASGRNKGRGESPPAGAGAVPGAQSAAGPGGGPRGVFGSRASGLAAAAPCVGVPRCGGCV